MQKLSSTTKSADHLNGLLRETEATNAILMEQIKVRSKTADKKMQLAFLALCTPLSKFKHSQTRCVHNIFIPDGITFPYQEILIAFISII